MKKKKFKFNMAALLALYIIVLLLIVSCKKTDVNAPLPQSQDAFSLDEQLQKVKDAAASTLNGTLGGEEGQTVFVPAPGQTQQPGSNAVSRGYISPCIVSKYKVLNKYCSFKNFWHNQSTLLSWYVPYSIVLFILFLFLVWLSVHLWRQR